MIPINFSSDDDDICCICLESCLQESCANLKCCKISIHDRCLFRIVLHNLHKCPVCRRDMDVAQLFSDKVIREYFKSFSKQEQAKYMHVHNYLLSRHYRLYCCSIFSSRTSRILCVLISICLFYACMFVALTIFYNTTHTSLSDTDNYEHISYRNINPYYQCTSLASNSLEYNDIMN